MDEQEIKEYASWYHQERPFYELLANKVAGIIGDILDSEKVSIYNVKSRAKEINKFEEKIRGPISFNPKDMQDLAGIRIICYLNSDVEKVANLIQSHFSIDKSRSIDKSQVLRVDQVGYKSIHLVAKLSPERVALPEFKKFEGKYFEIQIRTILQHSWAEIEHDRNYKFSGILPPEIQRRFFLIAANLEMADNEFNTLSELIDGYSRDVSKKTKEGKLDIIIDSTSLTQFMIDEFGDLPGLELDFGPHTGSRIVIKELTKLGIKTLKNLKEIIPPSLKENIKKYKESANFLGIIRTVLIVHNADDYFKKAWGKTWQGFNSDSIKLYEEYGVKVSKICEDYGLRIFED